MPNQIQKFFILFDTTGLIIKSYNYHPWLPNWLFYYWHPRSQQVNDILTAIRRIRQDTNEATDYQTKEDELIKVLNFYRYMLSVHVISHLLREKVQDALLACLSFDESDIAAYQEFIVGKHDIGLFATHLFQDHKEIPTFIDFLKKRHTVYGREVAYLTDQEIAIAAKDNLINGKLAERFGGQEITHYVLTTLKKELMTVRQKKLFAGYLNEATVNGYLEKIENLIQLTYTESADISELIHHCRYLLEDIINTAGIRQLGPAQHIQHAVLITSCYWLDELLQQAYVLQDVFITSD